MIDISYFDTVTIYKVSSGGYSNSKVVESSDDVACLFLQNTGFNRNNHQEAVSSDAICYPDPENTFLINNHYRLEGMYVLAPFFNADDEDGWYKVESVTINKDILLENKVGNIVLGLKKTAKLNLVS